MNKQDEKKPLVFSNISVPTEASDAPHTPKKKVRGHEDTVLLFNVIKDSHYLAKQENLAKATGKTESNRYKKVKAQQEEAIKQRQRKP